MTTISVPDSSDGDPTVVAEAGDARARNARRPTGPWLTATEAAEYLRVAKGTLRNWTSMRYVPHTKRGRLVRYHRDELDKWMASGARRGRRTLSN
jgi:excisionase family DNA binding protein